MLTERVSACDLLLDRAYQEFWQRGEAYEREGRVELLECDDRHAVAQARGTKVYRVELAFRGAGISRQCSCPYASSGVSRRPPCKHVIAAAILWDEARGIPRPSPADVEKYTIPPPLITRAQIDACYRDPLNADLEVLRLAADEFALSPRAHTRLPNMPAFTTDEDVAPTLEEVRSALREIKDWTRRRQYDRYFCAGEMVAATCEVLRIVIKRLEATPPLVGAAILREAQQFHYRLVQDLIDDSEGGHIFTEAHLEEIARLLKEREQDVPMERREEFCRLLQEYEGHRDDY